MNARSTKPSKLSPGQHKDETPAEYLRRVVSHIGSEREGMLDDLPSVEAVLDFFGLWSVYDTDYWDGCMESIADGEDPAPARAFVTKHGLGEWWTNAINRSVEVAQETDEEEQ